MTLQEVMKLVNAGFTADDVRKMMAEEPKQESKQEQPAPAKNEKQDIEKKPEIEKPEEPKKEAAAPSFEDVISGINQKIDALAGAVNKISSISMFPSLEGIKPLGIDDVVDKFFKEE